MLKSLSKYADVGVGLNNGIQTMGENVVKIVKQEELVSIKKKGKETINPFFNFLRDFRQENVNLNAIQITKEGALVWRSMPDEKKWPYIVIAYREQQRRRKKSPKKKANGFGQKQPKNKKKKTVRFDLEEEVGKEILCLK